MKTASIYKRLKKGYIVFGSSKTISGFRIASEPFITISETEANADTITNAIKASLCNDDTKRVPDPKNWSESNKNFLQKVGLKSLKELDNSETKLVLLSEDGDSIVFEPMQFQDKPGRGFVNTSKNEAFKVLNTASNQDIMTAYEFALNECR